MEGVVGVSHIVLWLVVLVQAVVIVALSRQVGLLHERISPVGALDLGKGPKVGERAPEFRLETLFGEPVSVGGELNDSRSLLLFFLSPTCPVCEQLIPVIRSLRSAESDWLDVILASDGNFETHRNFVRDKGLEDFPYIVSTELGMGFQVGRLPHAVLIDETGVVRAQGLVNTREHLESLFEAKERGVASVQEYMSGAKSVDHERNVA
jgi:methylamine dehydrogenase accessory protein MauD